MIKLEYDTTGEDIAAQLTRTELEELLDAISEESIKEYCQSKDFEWVKDESEDE